MFRLEGAIKSKNVSFLFSFKKLYYMWYIVTNKKLICGNFYLEVVSCVSIFQSIDASRCISMINFVFK